MRGLLMGVAIAMAATSVPQAALGWGATGHRMISELAMAYLPAELPAFLRTPDAARIVGELGREGDRSKGAGRLHGAERDPGHYIDLYDDQTVFGGPKIDNLPPTREDFDTAMRAVGQSQYKAGYLYYALIEGWLQLRIDFAYWRVLAAAEAAATDPARKAEYAADRKLREMLILRDLGYWSHFVADTSQPLHVSIHFNGWGNFPNPNNYSNSNTLHARFEGEFVHNNVTMADLRAALTDRPARDCACTIEQRTVQYILDSFKNIVPLYELEGKTAFVTGNAAGKAFAVERVAAAVAEVRDLVVFAWQSSATATVGFPVINVADVLAGKVDPYVAMFGAD
jgi:hypothetical protein